MLLATVCKPVLHFWPQLFRKLVLDMASALPAHASMYTVVLQRECIGTAGSRTQNAHRDKCQDTRFPVCRLSLMVCLRLNAKVGRAPARILQRCSLLVFGFVPPIASSLNCRRLFETTNNVVPTQAARCFRVSSVLTHSLRCLCLACFSCNPGPER